MKLDGLELEDRQIWLRAFYGFAPEHDGFIGFTKKGDRESVFDQMRDGDLVLIYGAVQEMTDPDLQRQALGFLEIRHERCADIDRQSTASKLQRKENGFEGRWTYGIKVSRAWRLQNRVHIRTIAPKAFHKDHRFDRTLRAVLLQEDEVLRALSHPVFQVNVFGEEPVSDENLSQGRMEEVLKPSTGIPPSFGERSANYQDGENHLYFMTLTAKAEALLGPHGDHVGKALVKIGRSNDTKRRLSEINGGFPTRAICKWELLYHENFPDGETAHALEKELKGIFAGHFTSQGNEFFSGDRDAMERAFQAFCISKLPKILAAPGKAKGAK